MREINLSPLKLKEYMEYTGIDLFNYLENDPEKQLRYLFNSNNYGNNLIEIKQSNLHSVLGASFSWDDTPEGTDYWNKLYIKLLKEYRRKINRL